MKKYLSFNKARTYVRKLKLTSYIEWKHYCQSGAKPNNIPSCPDRVYKNNGWSGYLNWLTDTRHLVKDRYLSFNKARKYARSLQLAKVGDWPSFASSGGKPKNIPSTPELIYADLGWNDYYDWLGIKKLKRGPFLPYEAAKKIVHSLNLKDRAEWKAYSRSGKLPENLPRDPYTVYRNKGYQGMGDWLNSGYIHTSERSYRPFIKARAWVRKQKLATYAEWRELAKSGSLPADIPRTPHAVYEEEWVSAPDWLGNRYKSRPNYRPDRTVRITRDFKPARTFARKLELSSSQEWMEYTRSGECPSDIPSDPRSVYAEWLSMADWLGISKRYKRFSKS